MKKRVFAWILSLTMVLGLLPAAAFAAEELPFQDLEPNAWYLEAVQYAYETGMMNGTGEGQFSPNATTTRAMVVTLLHRVEKTPEATGATFSDVAEGTWYAKAVAWASANGIVNGIGDGTFRPEDVITREQFATILYRYAKFKGVDVTGSADLSQFTDADAISPYAKEAMAWAVEVGLISGMGNGLLDPLGGATRAQAATILMRYETKVAPTAPAPSATPTPTATPKPSKRPSHGGGGGGGGGGGSDEEPTPTPTPAPTPTPEPAKTAIASVAIVDGKGHGVTEAAIGDELSLKVAPEAATYAAKWTVTNYTYTNGDDVTMVITAETYEKYSKKETYKLGTDTHVVTAPTYTVSAADASGRLTVEVTGTGDYTGTKTAQAEIEAARAFMVQGEKVARVSVAMDVTYKDQHGNTVKVSPDSVLALTIAPQASPKPVGGMGTGADAAAKKASVLKVIEKAAGADTGSLDNVDLPEDADSAEVEVALKLDNREIHPVGKAVVLLSAQELGLSAGAKLDEYVFFAQHTNVDSATELDAGKVVTVDGKQYVQFTLNGLSRVWIGNVPPRTVTFDAAGGAPTPPPQKVKFGGYAKYVEPPVRSGYLFAGWDHDSKTQNILINLTITAQWVKGQTATDDQLLGAWSPAAPEAGSYTETRKDGKLQLDFTKPEGYAANLSYTLTMKPLDGAVKFAAATTAEGALAATAYQPVAGNEAGYSITQAVTDAKGVPVDSSTNLYIKWVDAGDTPITLQSMTLSVGSAENYDTKTRKETMNVDRGLGRVSAYLTGGKAAVTVDGVESAKELPDFEGAVNAYLQRNYVDGKPELSLDQYFDFYESFYNLPELPNTRVDDRNYSGIKLVLTPFEGESFTAAPTVTATYRNAAGEWDTPLETTAALENGNVVITSPKPPVDWHTTRVYYELTLEGKTQEIEVYWSAHNGSDSSKDAETWAQVLELLQADENAYVRYTGAEDVTLTQELMLKPGQELYFTKGVTMTIGKGGKLTLMGGNQDGANLNLGSGSLVVADGGVLATNQQSSDQSNYFYTYVRSYNGGKTTVERGGQIQVPVYGYLEIRTDGGIQLREGSSASTAGYLWFQAATELAGTLTVTCDTDHRYARAEFENGLTVTSTGSVTTQDERARFQVYGGLTNEGEITLNSKDNILSGASVNKGTITVTADGTLDMDNMGYSVRNEGTLRLDGEAYVDAAVLVNTGSITGSGTLSVGEDFDAEASYDNGVEYIDEGMSYDEETPAKYPRYKFVRDPAATVEATVFMGELSNQGEGTCTVTVQK